MKVPEERPSGGYTRPMSDVAEEVRKLHAERVRRMSAAERVELALSLGWEGLETFRIANGLTRTEALRRMRAGRQRGRTPCSFLGEPE